ncbi:MAG: hypothetical protein ACE5SW_06195 [Nitrososphaeraceae archaeon]
MYHCFKCGKNFPRNWNGKRHFETIHNKDNKLKSNYPNRSDRDINSVKNQLEKNLSNKVNTVGENASDFSQGYLIVNKKINPYHQNEVPPVINTISSESNSQSVIESSKKNYENYLKEREKVSLPLLLLRINQRLSFMSLYPVRNPYLMSLYMKEARRKCIAEKSTELLDNVLKKSGLYNEFQKRFSFSE